MIVLLTFVMSVVNDSSILEGCIQHSMFSTNCLHRDVIVKHCVVDLHQLAHMSAIIKIRAFQKKKKR